MVNKTRERKRHEIKSIIKETKNSFQKSSREIKHDSKNVAGSSSTVF